MYNLHFPPGKVDKVIGTQDILYHNGDYPQLTHHYNLLRRYIVDRHCSIHYHHCIHAYQGRSWRKASGDIFLRAHQRHDYSLRWRLKPKRLCKDRLSPLPNLLQLVKHYSLPFPLILIALLFNAKVIIQSNMRVDKMSYQNYYDKVDYLSFDILNRFKVISTTCFILNITQLHKLHRYRG